MNTNTIANTNAPIAVAGPNGPAALVITRARTADEWRRAITARLLTSLDAAEGDPADTGGSTQEHLQAMARLVDEFEQAAAPGWRDLFQAGTGERMGILPSPEFYAAYRINMRLPRYYVLVGWLDADGYRHGEPALPLPTPQFLREQWTALTTVQGTPVSAPLLAPND